LSTRWRTPSKRQPPGSPDQTPEPQPPKKTEIAHEHENQTCPL
jgi:hypothetical protein